MTDFIDGRWYWVKDRDTLEWFPAKRDGIGSYGGWTNDDTWEGFDLDVSEAILIPTPEELKTLKKDDCPNDPMCPCCQKRLGIGESAQKVTP